MEEHGESYTSNGGCMETKPWGSDTISVQSNGIYINPTPRNHVVLNRCATQY